MEDPADLAKRYNQIKERVWGSILSNILRFFPKWAHTPILYGFVILAIVLVIVVPTISSVFDLNNVLNLRRYFPPYKRSVSVGRDNKQGYIPTTVDEAKLQNLMQTPCNTRNNFESTIWKRSNFRVITSNSDSGDPEYVGAIQKEPFQSQMVYPFDCSLPLTATISATIRSEKSIGLIFEYDGVFQVIVGDGDRKAIRYKIDTQGIRNFGWEYLKQNGKTVVHWLKNNGIAFGSEVDLTVKIAPKGNNTFSLWGSINYKTDGTPYGLETLEPLDINVQSFNVEQNNGRKIRIGINDRVGLSEVKFDQFSIADQTNN